MTRIEIEALQAQIDAAKCLKAISLNLSLITVLLERLVTATESKQTTT